MKKKKIVIIGSGVVGQATGRGFLEHGHDVAFCDVDRKKLDELTKEGLTALHPDDLSDDTFDVYFISIQTPTNEQGVDLSPIRSALPSIGKAIKNHAEFPVVATRSTVPIGTALKTVIPELEKHSGKVASKDFGVASNPEYLREQMALEDFRDPRLILIGSEDEKTKAILEELYKTYDVPIHHLSTQEAEMQKYVHNLFNAAKISFFNEQRRVCEAQGLSADAIFPIVVESAEASWNPRYGTKNLGPYSGMCLPKDMKGFIKWAKDELGMDLHLLKSAEEVNEIMKREAEER